MQGFLDVSFRISPETNEGSSYEGDESGIKLRIRDDGINLLSPTRKPKNRLQPDYYSGGGPNYPSSGNLGYQPPYTPSPAPPSYHHPRTQPSLTYQYAGGSNHQPLLPPHNVGYMPSSLMDSYMNMPSSSSSGPRAGRPGPGFAMGLGAGALAAGAVIFRDDLVSGFDLPAGFTISTNPPF